MHPPDITAKYVAEQGNPVIRLDTCSILDVMRDPARRSVSLEEQTSSLFLLNQVMDRNITAVATTTVLSEFQRWQGLVREETAASIREIFSNEQEQLVNKVSGLAMNLDIDPTVQLDVIANFASEAALIAQGWLLHSLIIEVEPYIEFRASERVLKQRAPSRLGKPSYADCEILETYILFADHLRKFDSAIDQPIVFVSSNTRDFMRNQILHDDVAQDFYPLGMTYAKSMFEARRGVLEPY